MTHEDCEFVEKGIHIRNMHNKKGSTTGCSLFYELRQRYGILTLVIFGPMLW